MYFTTEKYLGGALKPCCLIADMHTNVEAYIGSHRVTKIIPKLTMTMP